MRMPMVNCGLIMSMRVTLVMRVIVRHYSGICGSDYFQQIERKVVVYRGVGFVRQNTPQSRVVFQRMNEGNDTKNSTWICILTFYYSWKAQE